MNRRAFLLSSVAGALVTAVPLPALASAPIGRWYAVGTDEMAHPYWATSRKAAALQYAEDYGAYLGDECPECGESNCKEHIDPAEWGEPSPWIEVNEPKSFRDVPPNRDPTNAEWARGGFNVPCHYCQDEPTECYIVDDMAVCEDCYFQIPHAKSPH